MRWPENSGWGWLSSLPVVWCTQQTSQLPLLLSWRPSPAPLLWGSQDHDWSGASHLHTGPWLGVRTSSLSISVSLCLSDPLSLSISLCRSACLSFSLPMCLCLCQSLSLSVSLCLSLRVVSRLGALKTQTSDMEAARARVPREAGTAA